MLINENLFLTKATLRRNITCFEIKILQIKKRHKCALEFYLRYDRKSIQIEKSFEIIEL